MDDFDAAMASIPAKDTDDAAPEGAMDDDFDAFGGAFGAADDAGAGDEDEDPAADVKSMAQVLMNERAAHMDLLPHR